MDVVPIVFGSGKRYFGSVHAQHLLEEVVPVDEWRYKLATYAGAVRVLPRKRPRSGWPRTLHRCARIWSAVLRLKRRVRGSRKSSDRDTRSGTTIRFKSSQGGPSVTDRGAFGAERIVGLLAR
jgi:hypothetical protein